MRTSTKLRVLARALPTLAAGIALNSCALVYTVDHEWRLDEANETEPLSFSDGRFLFNFTPVRTGIWFTVENLTETDARLDWDKSFFVQPDGNTYKALNTDALDEADEIVAKSQYSSMLPSRGKLARFTTASVNAKKKNSIRISEVGSASSYSHWTYNPSRGTWVGTSSGLWSKTTNLESIESWSVPIYWTSAFMASEGAPTERALETLAETLKAGSTFGLGLAISRGEEESVYRFNFRIDQVFISARTGGGGREPGQDMRTKRELELRYILLSENDWAWLDVREQQ